MMAAMFIDIPSVLTGALTPRWWNVKQINKPNVSFCPFRILKFVFEPVKTD